MKGFKPRPTLKNLIARYKTDIRLLEKYSEQPKERQLLEKRIERHKRDIIAYVTSEYFECILEKYDF